MVNRNFQLFSGRTVRASSGAVPGSLAQDSRSVSFLEVVLKCRHGLLVVLRALLQMLDAIFQPRGEVVHLFHCRRIVFGDPAPRWTARIGVFMIVEQVECPRRTSGSWPSRLVPPPRGCSGMAFPWPAREWIPLVLWLLGREESPFLRRNVALASLSAPPRAARTSSKPARGVRRWLRRLDHKVRRCSCLRLLWTAAQRKASSCHDLSCDRHAASPAYARAAVGGGWSFGGEFYWF